MSFWRKLFGGGSAAREPAAPVPVPIPPALAAVCRTAFVPIVEDGDGEVTASKYAGVPWLAAGEQWPLCPSCGKPLQLFLQLDLASLPADADVGPRDGLIQLFYCTTSEPLCEVECEAWAPFARSVVARIVRPHGEAAAVAIPSNAFPPKRIVGWEPEPDYPNREEARMLGIEGELDAYYASADRPPLTGDKLGGFPYWVQSMDYPSCPQCNAPMSLVYQIDSDVHVPYMWGDTGCAHLTRCRAHPDVLAFTWECC